MTDQSSMTILKDAVKNNPDTFTTVQMTDQTGLDKSIVTSLMHTLVINEVIFRWGKKGTTPFYRNHPIPTV